MRDKTLTTKDMSVLREGDSARTQHKSNHGSLKDYSLKHKVRVEWDLNDDAKQEKIFKLRVDDKSVLLDAEEVVRVVRWV